MALKKTRLQARKKLTSARKHRSVKPGPRPFVSRRITISFDKEQEQFIEGKTKSGRPSKASLIRLAVDEMMKRETAK